MQPYLRLRPGDLDTVCTVFRLVIVARASSNKGEDIIGTHTREFPKSAW